MPTENGQSNEQQSNDHTQASPDHQIRNPDEGPDPSMPNPENHTTNIEDTQHPNDRTPTQDSTSSNNHANGDPNHQTSSSPSAVTAAAETDVIDPKATLEPYQWDELEERFVRKMEECGKREEEIEMEFREWCLVFQAWASTTREHEEERLHKRLRTRMAWVQNSENTLEEKRQHYIKVVQAFESALALLSGGVI
ncbi:MAG: hypothetical protein Q9220_006791 [cf. Caloplaca sp. 1 TL-2023]